MPPDSPRSSHLMALAKDTFSVFQYLSAYCSNSTIHSIPYWKPWKNPSLLLRTPWLLSTTAQQLRRSIETRIHFVEQQRQILKTNQSFGRHGGIKMFCLCKTCWTFYLSPQEFSDKYNIKVNFLQYYQITSAIPAYLKSFASAHMDLGDLNSICEKFDFQLPKDITLNLKKTLCKQFYRLFVEEINTEPTAIKSWRKNCLEVADNWWAALKKQLKNHSQMCYVRREWLHWTCML